MLVVKEREGISGFYAGPNISITITLLPPTPLSSLLITTTGQVIRKLSKLLKPIVESLASLSY
jgi:hypothetical protein